MGEQESDSSTGTPGTVGGGRSAHGPTPDPGGETQVGGLVPPYDGRSRGRGESESSDALTASIERQMEHTDPGNRGATASPADEQPVSPGAANASGGGTPESPHGVGESTSRRGEDVVKEEGKEPGRSDDGVEDTPAARPYGSSSPRDVTGVNPPDAS